MKSLNRTKFLLACTLAAASALAGAWSALAQGAKTVRIAVAMPLTGDMGTEGQGVRRAVEMAVAEANQSKAFPYTLEVKALDDRADPREAVNVANLITSDPGVAVVIGHYNSGCSIPAAKIYARAGIPMITPASTNPDVTGQQLNPKWTGKKSVFRVVPTDDVQGEYAAQYVYSKLGYRKMSVVHDKTAYGQGLAEQFKKNFEKLGGKVNSFDGISIGDKDFKALLTRIKSTGPEGIYFGGVYTEAGLLMKQGRELGITVPFVSGDGAKTPTLFDVAGAAAEGSYLTITGIPVEYLATAKDFIANYKKRYSGPGNELKPFDHFGYEATRIALEALKKSGPDRAKLINALHQTKYDGLLGTTTFDAKGDTLNKIITMTKASFKDRSFPPVK
ncbi:MAG: branched-chain amino acid ABC transporter substrate-binding protein [Elusimicrobia bacterium]|nr:branched-chain amino acid ABC transporter substrate-binding protein [Elusimicrobiota bacterium]